MKTTLTINNIPYTVKTVDVEDKRVTVAEDDLYPVLQNLWGTGNYTEEINNVDKKITAFVTPDLLQDEKEPELIEYIKQHLMPCGETIS